MLYEKSFFISHPLDATISVKNAIITWESIFLLEKHKERKSCSFITR